MLLLDGANVEDNVVDTPPLLVEEDPTNDECEAGIKVCVEGESDELVILENAAVDVSTVTESSVVVSRSVVTAFVTNVVEALSCVLDKLDAGVVVTEVDILRIPLSKRKT